MSFILKKLSDEYRMCCAVLLLKIGSIDYYVPKNVEEYYSEIDGFMLFQIGAGDLILSIVLMIVNKIM